MPETITANREQRLRIQNSTPAKMSLYLEPWGDCLELAPGQVIQVVAFGPDGDFLQVEFGVALVAVYAWTGATLKLLTDDSVLRSYPLAPPSTPG